MIKLCINLDSRPDRWEQVTKEFDRVGLQVERLAAVSGDNRPLAFNQSVYKAMERAKGDALLLFEDDVVFDNKYVSVPMPQDFMTLHLGCNIMGTDVKKWDMPEAYSAGLAKLHNCWQSHATLYSAKCVHFILDNFDPNVLTEDNNIFDDWLRRKVLSQGNSYVLKPMIAYQRDSFSDIWQTEARYKHYHTEGNKYLANL